VDGAADLHLSGVRRPSFAVTKPRKMGGVFLTGRPRPVADLVSAIHSGYAAKAYWAKRPPCPLRWME
jgi:hypothetical protein